MPVNPQGREVHEAKRGVMRFLAVALLVWGLAGCGRALSPRPDLVIVQTQGYSSLNPVFASGFGAQGLAALLFTYLVKIDDHGNLVPDAALAVPSMENGGISADGLTVVYHLRRDLRFSDGSSLTAYDVVATIARMAQPNSGIPSRMGFGDVASVTATDRLTVRVRLRHPLSSVVLYLCGPGNAVPILSSHDVDGSSQFSLDTKPLGSGPYRVERWNRDQNLELRANPYYYGGVPHIKRLTLQFVASSSTAIEMLRSREADAYVNADDSQLSQLRAIDGIRVNRILIDGTGAIFFNTQDPVLRDRRVRRALASAFDARTIVNKTLRDSRRAVDPGRGLFEWAYDARAFAMPPSDPQTAGALLEQAGWNLGDDGIRRKGGQSLSFDLIVRTDKPSNIAMATEIQAAERAVGVQLTIRRLPIASLVDPNGPLYGGGYQLALYPFIAGFDPDVTDQFACSRMPPHGFNKPRYCNPALDRLLYHAQTTYDRKQRASDYRIAQTILARDLPLDVLYQTVSINAFPNRLQGQTTAVTTPFWNVAAWHY